MDEVKLPLGWKPPFTTPSCGPHHAVFGQGYCYVANTPRKEDAVCIAHALNTAFSPDGEIARARKKIEELEREASYWKGRRQQFYEET